MPDLDLYVHGLELGAEVELYEIDYSNVEGGNIIRLTPAVVPGRTTLGFGDETFLSYPVKLEGIQWDGKNAPTQPSLTIAEMDGMLSSLIDGFDGLLGAKVTRYRTYERYLDFVTGVTDPNKDMIGAEPDFDQRFPDEVYFFEQVKNFVPGEFASFNLATLGDVRGKKIPGRNVIKKVCVRPYRRPDPNNPGQFKYSPRSFKCPYTDNQYWDINDKPTTAAGDRCSHLETGCKLRFPDGLPSYAFPAVSTARS